MRLVRYRVATSLDGFIAGPKGEFDWIVTDPEVDFTAIAAQFGKHEQRSFVLVLRVGLDLVPQHAGEPVGLSDRLQVERVGTPVRHIHVPKIDQQDLGCELSHHFSRDEKAQLISGAGLIRAMDVVDQGLRESFPDVRIKLLPRLENRPPEAFVAFIENVF